MNQITNAMTVDVEDYFQVSAFEKNVNRSDWASQICRVEANTNRVLDLFIEHEVSATFFILGWIAERYPELIKRIADEGHEIASHGYDHTRVVNQNPEEFRRDIQKTQRILENISGKRVIGYRAASFSIGRDNLWALDILGEEGYEYSSSIFPIHHDLYGMPEASRFPFKHNGTGILEVPITTVRLAGKNLPSGGGGYFRLFPYGIYRWCLNRVNTLEEMPGVFYFHPWEIDPEQPVQDNISMKTRIRHYTNLSRMEAKLTRLMQDFNWDRMDRVFL